MKKLIAALVMALGLFALASPTPAQAETATICPSGLTAVATPDTSCEFADNVRANWYSQPGTTIVAYSPKTGLYYTMQCRYQATDAWYNSKRCAGINSFGAVLVVYIA